MKIKAAILTISTRGSKGQLKDTSAEIIKEMLEKIQAEVIAYQVIPDDKEMIKQQLLRMSDTLHADLILTTGGTGLSPTDVTPEATLEVIEKRVPGFEEVMRITGFKSTPHAILSRAVVGTYGSTLIVNLPGNPKGVQENLATILSAIPHGIKILKGAQVDDKEHRSG